VLVLASFIGDYATATGALAGSIAVMGFVFQVVPALRKSDDVKVRRMTMIGGLLGLLIGTVVVFSPASLW
jgi:uncharacterized membrane protein HdeD (DUF308 family)